MHAPNLIDQRIAFENQIEGMTAHEVTYANYEDARTLLHKTVQESLVTSTSWK